MKFKLLIIMLLLGLAGCQQKSEVDKCVEAEATQKCNRQMAGSDGPLYKSLGKNGEGKDGFTESNCVEFVSKIFGGDLRKECLQAQLGNKWPKS